jgi:hypothetical protein
MVVVGPTIVGHIFDSINMDYLSISTYLFKYQCCFEEFHSPTKNTANCIVARTTGPRIILGTVEVTDRPEVD